MLCPACQQELAWTRPLPGATGPGLDATWAAAPYQGVVRELVAALKFRHLLPVAELMAQRIAATAPVPLAGVVVAVPAEPMRQLGRGFDPAQEIATRLARLAGLALSPCLTRSTGPRQVGRRRVERLAEPPRIQALGPAPRSSLVVDDVQTTGATLAACARALRAAGANSVIALSFAGKP